MSTRARYTLTTCLLLGLLVALLLAAQACQQRRSVALPTTAPAGLHSVRVASWNIRQFTDRPDLDLPTIARIIRDSGIDLLAIQEVKKDGRAVDRLLQTLGSPWRASEISPMTGNSERFAFIYRGDRVQQLAPAVSADLSDPAIFDRLPYTARFRANHFDFELITVHLSYTDTSRRRLEAQTLARYAAELSQRQAEKDILILGDFNEQRARPNFDLFTAAGWAASIKTGTNLSSRETFDNILYNPLYTREWSAAGVVNFDELYFGNQDKPASAAVSDHRPVFVDFIADQPDDD